MHTIGALVRNEPIKRQIIETTQLICRADQLTGFYIWSKLLRLMSQETGFEAGNILIIYEILFVFHGIFLVFQETFLVFYNTFLAFYEIFLVFCETFLAFHEIFLVFYKTFAVFQKSFLVFQERFLAFKERFFAPIGQRSHQSYSVKKGVQNPQENTCGRVSFLMKLQACSPATLFKKILWHRCFPVDFAKFLRISLLQNTSGECFWK